MTKEQVIQGYLMNSPKVVAEMLYETIERYENRSCETLGLIIMLEKINEKQLQH